MENLCLSGDPINKRLPLLGIQKNQIVKTTNNDISLMYLSNDVINNINLTNNEIYQSNGGKISNLWTNPIRRKRFKHLYDNPICVCGAGNDIQFLHDKPVTIATVSEVAVISDKDKRRGKKQEDKLIMKVPNKLIPSEFDLVFHHGSNSIQLHDEKHGTKLLSHKNHNISLPVMHPNNQIESHKIYHSLVNIFQESGLNDIFDNKLPTSLHRLLLLVKKEQDLYNLVFHDLIKQTTIDCIDRGELLANIRQRYRNIFVGVPQKIKDFHDMVIAQRILDRRLTEELTRFQSTIAGLTNELNGVKNHEYIVNEMYNETKDKLQQAVEETKTNADLLREYYGLYELQRRRLEKSSSQLENERDCWRTAAYTLTRRVLNNYKITPGITLVDMEKQWLYLSSYFVEILTKSDVHLLNTIKSKVVQWYNEAQNFSMNLTIRDENIKNILEKEIEKINCLKEDFEDDYFTEQGHLIQPLGKTETVKIFNAISSWEKTMSYVSELFGGQSMVAEEEKLSSMKKLCFEYTDIAIEVFNRHRKGPDELIYEEHETLLVLNKTIDQMMNQFYDQLTGDNGVADGIMTVQTYLENWLARITNNLSDSFFRPLPESEWIRFKLILDDWVALLEESKRAIGSIKSSFSETKFNKKVEVVEVIQSVDNWSQRSYSGIESENLKLHEAIINLQRNMILWTAQIVIRLAPDFPNNSPEARRTARMASVSIKELQEKNQLLHDNINKITNNVINSSKNIVTKLVQQKLETQNESPDEDNVRLQNFQASAKSWIVYSQEILKEMLEVEYSSQIKTQETNEIVQESIEKEANILLMAEEKEDDEINVANLIDGLLEDSMFNFERIDEEPILELVDPAPIVHGVGVDTNVHSQLLVQDPDQPYAGNKFKNFANLESQLSLPETNDAFTLIQISQLLQMRLRIRNKVAQESENEFTNADLHLTKSKLYLKSLEERCLKIEGEIEELKNETSLILPTPVLLLSTNTLEHQVSQSTDKSGTPKSVSSSRHRAPTRNTKKKK